MSGGHSREGTAQRKGGEEETQSYSSGGRTGNGLCTYTASEKVWALPNLFTRVYTRLEVVWSTKPLRCRYSRTRLGGWRVAQSPILGTTITGERLNRRGYLDLLDYYHQRKLH